MNRKHYVDCQDQQLKYLGLLKRMSLLENEFINLNRNMTINDYLNDKEMIILFELEVVYKAVMRAKS